MELTFTSISEEVQKEKGTSIWMKSPWGPVLGLSCAWYLTARYILSWLDTATRLAASAHWLGLLEQMLRSQALGNPRGESSFGHLPALQGRDSFNLGLLRCAPYGSIFKENKVADVPGSSTGPWLWCKLCEPRFPSLWSRENNWTWRLIGITVF